MAPLFKKRKISMAPNINKVSSNNYYIHDDVSFSILSKLPLKSLKRFTSACKSWSQLFENPTFMKIYFKNFMYMHQSLYNDTSFFVNMLEIKDLPDYQEAHNFYWFFGDKFVNKVKMNLNWNNESMLHSCINDVLCFSDLNEETISIWKPSTKQLVDVDSSPAELLSVNNVFFNLHGCGYDHVNDDYKIIRHVRISEYKPDDDIDWNYLPLMPHPFWEIYSVKSSSWKRLDFNMPESIGLKVYLNGFCHWFADGDNTYMVSFNLSNEMVFNTLLPLDMQDSFPDEWTKTKSVDPMDRYVDLVVLNEYVVMISKHVKTSCFHIYILGEIGARESLTRIFIIGQLPSLERPIGVGKKGEVFFLKNDKQLACFDLYTQTIEDLGVEGYFYGTIFAICKKTLFRLAE